MVVNGFRVAQKVAHVSDLVWVCQLDFGKTHAGGVKISSGKTYSTAEVI
jgi:hypothetical protein